MRNKVKLGMCSALLVSSLVGGTLSTSDMVAHASSHVAQQVGNPFKDVSKKDAAYEAILWASKEGIVSGYKDGTFKPNDKVTEAQFAKMLVNYFKLDAAKGTLMRNSGERHWSDDFYDQLASYSVPLNGYVNEIQRFEPVKRGVVAEALAYLAKDEMTLKDSIQFLYDNKVSSGQNPTEKLIEQHFGYANDVTRSQVIVFFYKLHLANIKSVQGKQALSQYASNDDIEKLAKQGTSYLFYLLTKGSIHVDLERGKIRQEETEDYNKRYKALFDSATFKFAERVKNKSAGHELFDFKALDKLEKELKPETIQYLNQHYVVDGATSGDDHYLIFFVDKNDKYLTINYGSNDFATTLYGKRKYHVRATGNTPTANQALAMIVSDITGEKRTTTEIDSYKNWIDNKKNLSYEYGYAGNLVVRFGIKTYLTGFPYKDGEFSFTYFPDKTRNGDYE
ncbi:S-layer homology domain-containing protein [Lysinibacillus sp. fls2-241-R2A-57]|uniref:S-layer homology domain-containing protein n=1 Tax=Lysinibacillus sp. fls2-241-R2A-57 TaxID=3040292 RepID=UPI0025557B7B|nr:S-layer homology domain-containing protein [Lysinibacillus sp. fls2-241-R2A-57]